MTGFYYLTIFPCLDIDWFLLSYNMSLSSWSEDIRLILRGVRGAETGENTIFSTLKMQFQGLLTHRLLGFPTNATPPNLLGEGNPSYFLYLSNNITSSLCWIKIVKEKNCFRYLIDEWLPFPMVWWHKL